jgi:hypothetical protein
MEMNMTHIHDQLGGSAFPGPADPDPGLLNCRVYVDPDCAGAEPACHAVCHRYALCQRRSGQYCRSSAERFLAKAFHCWTLDDWCRLGLGRFLARSGRRAESLDVRGRQRSELHYRAYLLLSPVQLSVDRDPGLFAGARAERLPSPFSWQPAPGPRAHRAVDSTDWSGSDASGTPDGTWRGTMSICCNVLRCVTNSLNGLLEKSLCCLHIPFLTQH